MTSAFASVARRGHTFLSRLWLLGWIMILIHFAAFLFLSAPAHWGDLASYIGLAALACGGVLFKWASVPYRKQTSSPWMLAALLGTHFLYLGLLMISPAASWALAPVASLYAILPLVITLFALRRFNHFLRWSIVGIYFALSIFLLIVEHRPDNGITLATNAVFFAIFLSCAIHFWYAYRRTSAGAFITVAGFFAWASVFVIAPCMDTYFPNIHFESEVWNLPKYLVAMGMILLLLEDQIEHNKYLALHDELTSLPNRRLFQDRLASALERARRTNARAALLLVDLDRFKEVNDSVGHHLGDELLKHVANTFTGRVRRSDTVARTGGDEFSVILEEPASREDANNVSTSLAELLNNPITIEGHTLCVGASIGIAVFPEDAADAESLCIAADRRMYDAKRAARVEAPIHAQQAPPRFPPAEAKGYPPAEVQHG